MKKGWKEFYSKKLQMVCRYKTEPEEVLWTEDLVKYDKKELDLLKKCGISKMLHEIKKIFNGKIVEINSTEEKWTQRTFYD